MASNKEIYIRIYALAKPYKVKLLLAMVCMVVFAGLSTTQAWMVKPLLDKIFVEKDAAMLRILPVALIALFAVKGVFQFFYSYLVEEVGLTIIKNLRVRFYDHIMRQPLGFFHNTSTGELVSKTMNDTGLLQNAVSDVIVTLLRDFFRVITLLAYILYQDWKLSIMSFLFLPGAFYAISSLGKHYRRYSSSLQQAMAESYSFFHETFAGSRIVKAFGMERFETRQCTNKLDQVVLFSLKDARLRSFAKPLMEIFGGLGIAAIMWYGGSQVLNGQSTPGTFFSFLTALIMIYEPIKNLSGLNNTIQKGVAAAIRVFEVMDTPAEEIDKGDDLASTLPIKQITFDQVHFSYDGNKQVLDGVSLSVRNGEILAIVGTSGGGKTTLANLIPRFHEVNEGKILINGTNIKELSMASLRNNIAIVSQETILFNDTVRNNIAYGEREFSDHEVEEAAKAAHALDFIKELPQGFDTVIGESGSRLSGGQRQRLSIARALLKDAPILILDEATSALDTEAEREVQRALDNLMRNRTTFVIAHRLSTIKKANRIIVLQEGKIIEEGTHDSLLAQKGAYERFYNMQ